MSSLEHLRVRKELTRNEFLNDFYYAFLQVALGKSLKMTHFTLLAPVLLWGLNL